MNHHYVTVVHAYKCCFGSDYIDDECLLWQRNLDLLFFSLMYRYCYIVQELHVWNSRTCLQLQQVNRIIVFAYLSTLLGRGRRSGWKVSFLLTWPSVASYVSTVHRRFDWIYLFGFFCMKNFMVAWLFFFLFMLLKGLNRWYWRGVRNLNLGSKFRYFLEDNMTCIYSG